MKQLSKVLGREDLVRGIYHRPVFPQHAKLTVEILVRLARVHQGDGLVLRRRSGALGEFIGDTMHVVP